MKAPKTVNGKVTGIPNHDMWIREALPLTKVLQMIARMVGQNRKEARV